MNETGTNYVTISHPEDTDPTDNNDEEDVFVVGPASCDAFTLDSPSEPLVPGESLEYTCFGTDAIQYQIIVEDANGNSIFSDTIASTATSITYTIP